MASGSNLNIERVEPEARSTVSNATRSATRVRSLNAGDVCEHDVGGLMANPNEIDLTVVVNGQPVALQVSTHVETRSLIERAFSKSGNQGQPLANWELRDAGGQILDPAKKLGDYGISDGVTLFLNLKAGVGGQR
jgi:hypothetical protein